MSSIRRTETQLGRLSVQNWQTFSSIVWRSFLHLFDVPGAVILVQEGRPIAPSTFAPFPGLARLSADARAAKRGQRSEQDARCRFLQPTFKDRALARRPNLDRNDFRRHGPTRQSVPNERNDDRMGHEVHLSVSPESSEVRLTPQPQLRLNLVDRCEMDSQSRDPLGPHLGRRFRRSTRLTRSLLPLRVACRWTNPSRSDLAFTPRLACSAHTSMGRCDSQSEAASIAGFPT